jgi:hypothetical protein
MQYYVWCDDKEIGPYELKELRLYWAEDRFPVGTYARSETSSEWIELKDIVLPEHTGEVAIPIGIKQYFGSNSEDIQRNKLNLIGKIFRVSGAVIAVYFFLFYDTSVTTESHYISGVGRIGGERVNNLGLMQNRLLGSIFGMVLLVIGYVMVLTNPKKPTS